MKQIGFLFLFLMILLAGYAMAISAPESFATLLFGIGLISLASVGRKALVK